jgi:hypothetical protein
MTITDIFAEARKLVDSTSTAYADADVLRRVNAGYEDIVGTLINADGTWQFDDTNYTTTPVGTITLVEGQSSYTFLDTFLDIENVKILDKNGLWHMLDPIDQSQLDMPLEMYLIANSFPRYYDKNGNTLRLYPAPTATVITLTNGLKVSFKRTAQLFQNSDIGGSTAPGFASPWHMLLAYKAALPYAMSYKKDRVAMLNAEITRLTAGLTNHYGQRERDKRKVMTMKRIHNR